MNETSGELASRGHEWNKAGDYSNALIAFSDARAAALREGNLARAAACGFNAAQDHRRLEDGLAIDVFRRVRNEYVELNSESDVADCDVAIGMIAEASGDHLTAILHYASAKWIFQKVGTLEKVAQGNISLAGEHRSLRNSEQTERLLNEASAVFRQLGDRRGMVGVAVMKRIPG